MSGGEDDFADNIAAERANQAATLTERAEDENTGKLVGRSALSGPDGDGDVPIKSTKLSARESRPGAQKRKREDQKQPRPSCAPLRTTC